MPISSLEEAIQKEEAQIRLYEAELAVIQQKVQERHQQTCVPQTHDEDPLLEGLFEDSKDDSLSGKESRSLLPDVLPLTPSLQQFTFTSVSRHKSATLEDPSTSRYTLAGFFHTKPSMAVQLHLSIQTAEENENVPDKNISSKVIHFEVDLTTATKDDLLDLTAISMAGSENNSLPDWIQKISRFLNFEAHQSKTLEGWRQKYSFLYEKPKATKLVIFFDG